jgi:tripartite-type tricarboxylate transporter receptor subunit TctC
LNGELNRTLEDATVRSRMLTYGATIRTGTPEQQTELIVSEIEKWAKAVKATGARVD